MFGLNKIFNLSYDAVEHRSKRKTRQVNLKSEDQLLIAKKRKELISDTRNLQRNSSLADWAVGKHLDYVATFGFQSRTGNVELDARIEELVDWWGNPENFDVAARHGLQQFVRLAEERAVVDGDVFTLKLSSGHVQAIESDKVQTPPDFTKDDAWVHGVKVTASGKAVAYAICDRAKQGNSYELKTIIPAQYVSQLAYHDRFDQIRGITPFTSALNIFADLYEANEYALAKMKLSQLLGLTISRSGDIELGEETEEVEEGQPQVPQQIKFSGGEPTLIDLDPGETAGFLESNNPSDQFQAYMKLAVSNALKALDIPYSFYDESHTNYSGSRQALLQYEQSAKTRRCVVKRYLDDLTRWRLSLFVQDGVLVLPRGMSVSDLKWEWIGTGLPWIQPLQEANAEVVLINAGLTSRQDVCKSHGRDWHETLAKLKVEKQLLEEAGLSTDPKQSLPIIEHQESR